MAATLKDLREQAAKAHREGDLVTAQRLYAQYLAQSPGDAGVWSNLGVLHRAAGRHRIALRAHRRATALNPDAIGLQNNLANILSDIGEYEQSLALRRAIVAKAPDDLNQLAMIVRCLRGQGQYAEAIEVATKALAQHPKDPELRMQLAFAQLGAGDYAAGFQSYKARWEAGELEPRKLPIAEWQGEDLTGKTIAVLPEQGFGDGVLFARFLSVLQDRGAKIVFVTEKPVARLYQDLTFLDRISVNLQRGEAVDYYVNSMDLAAWHFAESDEIPPPTQLHVPQDSIARAKALVAPHGKAFKIGVVWSGSATYKGNAFRSFSHTDFLPLVDLPGVQLFSLYKGPYLDAFYADGSDAFMIDAAGTERDFADCAATMQQMDLVITSDTATAHIAGSLGVPVWVILHWDPFWVYRHTGGTTPWYPGMRLFRQSEPLEWSAVLGQVRDEVLRLLGSQR